MIAFSGNSPDPVTTQRERVRRAMADRRAAEQEIEIPAVADPARRKACEADVFLFLETYFPDSFDEPFTESRRAMVKSILHCAKYGGDQANAAPRGEGKTTIAECVVIYCIVTGILRFPIILAATGPDAARILANIKYQFETNELLCADYPEVCWPVWALENSSQRARQQKYKGKLTRLIWRDDLTVFAQIPGSKASGSVLMTRGLDAAIRGIRYLTKRPDFALIDDPETRESAASEHQVSVREKTVDRDVAGLGGPGKKLARVANVTVPNNRCLSAKLTDPKLKPAWGGKRYKLLEKFPDNEDLWEQYIQIRRDCQEKGDKDGREAHRFYLDRREKMDAGAIVSNEHRHVTDILPDGTQKQVSTLQFCYDFIADNGIESFASEFQNEPIEENEPEESGITDRLVRKQANGRPRMAIPDEAISVTGFIDLGKRACHYVSIAWLPGATGLIIDHDVQDVYPKDDDQESIENALVQALLSWRDTFVTTGFPTDGGGIRGFDKVLVDAGNWDTAAYQFCRQAGGTIFAPSKGVGKSERSPFNLPAAATATKKPGNHWIKSRQANGQWLHLLDADFWKRFAHDRFLTPWKAENGTFRNGSLSLYGDDTEHNRFAFSKHIVAEIETVEFKPGKGPTKKWVKKSANNHWLDCVYGACAAADMCGVSLFPKPATKPRMPLNQMGRKSA